MTEPKRDWWDWTALAIVFAWGMGIGIGLMSLVMYAVWLL